ncbi:T9SS type A sorting domain-containing protein [Dyadobacter subterraneus]|uniref:T9SS type A sorting domain-containing protein n=1 Tax=Dyadobacter subterraneus TaxID=2773304 RepID=A0ABR9W968_9BACT|nr:T9SS type A sorting domain-containing protein [Dyadobacter subterraneus]MBE9462013.1 T9SS type A sorting domain-containing protein [Dyadobacter subterraneus]
MKTNIFPSRIYNMLCRFLFLTTIMFSGVTQTFAETTWTGAINSDWNNAGNWSYGLPYPGQEVAIAASRHNPVIAAGVSVNIKAIAVQESALLTIQETASLTLDGSIGSPNSNYFGTSLVNLGEIVNSGSIIISPNTALGWYGINSQGNFTNQASGLISINRSTDTGLFVSAGNFTNKGNIVIGAQAEVGFHGIWNDGNFINSPGGTISIDRSSLRAIVNNSHTFATAGTITIGTNADVGENGIENRADLTIESCGKILLLRGQFYNETAKTTTNNGLVQITNKLVNKGSFTNNGVLEYFAVSGSVSNNQIIIGNTPAPIFTYPDGFTANIQGIFKDAQGTLSAGTLNSQNIFVHDESLPPGIQTLYAKVSLSSGNCPYIVPFTYNTFRSEAPETLTTWTGAISGNWNDAGNWSNGIPNTYSTTIIASTGVAASIGNGIAALAKSVEVQQGATLNIEADASLTLSYLSAYSTPFTFDYTAALNNLGTINNSGKLVSATSAGMYGVVNQGVFNNKPGAEIKIDDVTDTGLYNATGTFTNQASIIIGADASVGYHGIWNDAIFNNNEGSIQIDRSSLSALTNNADATKSIAATFNNLAAITLGAHVSPGNAGIENQSEFNNKTQGMIAIDQSTLYGLYHAAGVFTNDGSILLGSNASIGSSGMTSSANFINRGEILINRVSNFGFAQRSGNFDNYGTIRIGNIGSAGVNGLICDRTSNAVPIPSFFNYTGGAIYIDRTTESAMVAQNFTNTGDIVVGSIESPGLNGIITAWFDNKTGGHIQIDRANEIGIRSAGTFNNSARITIGGQAALGKDGITLLGTFNNLAGGDIHINRTAYIGLNVQSGTFNNTADLTIGDKSATGNWGIVAQGKLNNDGNINIDRAGQYAIYVFNGGFVSNSASIVIGANTSSGTHGIYNWSKFANNAGGDIRINRSTNIGLINFEADFTNDGSISIGDAYDVGVYGLVNRGTFKNNAGSQIHIDRSSDTGLYNYSIGSFENAGALTIGASAAVGVHGIFNETIFKNNEGGQIKIDRTALAALRNFNGTFSNFASIILGDQASLGTYGIRNQATFDNNSAGQIMVNNAAQGIFAEEKTFTNHGTVTIGQTTAIADLITQQGTGIFSNSDGGILKGTGAVAGNALQHAGGTLSPGYSPGIITFTGDQDFTSSIMDFEISGPGTPGVNFDQIIVNGTATLGGTLNLSSAYVPDKNDEIILLSATSISGTFGMVSGQSEKWQIIYTENTVKLRYFDPLPVTLINFTTRAFRRTVRLDWQTTSETNNSGFYIERSINARQWEEIGFLKGNGTAMGIRSYMFDDNSPKGGINYYRLRQVDLDGTMEYSHISACKVSKTSDELVIWADASRTAHIITDSPIQRVTVMSLSGQVIARSSESTTLDLSGGPSGIVLIQVWTEGEVITRKVILQ